MVNDVGLFSEESTRRRPPQSAQALTHLALVNAACAIRRAS
jgi:hypothetical protein